MVGVKLQSPVHPQVALGPTVGYSPIRATADDEDALVEIERLWGAKSGTLNGDRAAAIDRLIVTRTGHL